MGVVVVVVLVQRLGKVCMLERGEGVMVENRGVGWSQWSTACLIK